jgi:Bacterial PH domain
MANQYWIRSQGRETGPFDAQHVKGMALQGRIARTDSVSLDRQKWILADQIRGLEWPPSGPAPVALREADPTTTVISKFISDDQDPAVVAKLLGRVQELCTANEVIRYIAVQKKPVFTLSPDALVATTRRLIMLRTGLLGKSELVDFIWRDIQDANIKEHMLSATFSVLTVNGTSYIMDSIPKKQARALYRIAQEIEEGTREERRVRRMEEDRARSGGVHVNSTPPPTGSTSTESPSDALRALKHIHSEGLITDSEYEAKRQQIIARM